jgi:hypothetical protein
MMIAVDLEQLLDEHRRIDDRSVDILRLTKGRSLDLVLIKAGLQDLNRMMNAHIAHEDPLIYDVAQHLRTIGFDAHAVRMSTELEQLKQDWMEYFHFWTNGDLLGNPDQFRVDVSELLSRIRDRVRVESELLYFTALRHGLLTLRLDDKHSSRLDL